MTSNGWNNTWSDWAHGFEAMKVQRFSKQSEILAPPAEVFAWHEQPTTLVVLDVAPAQVTMDLHVPLTELESAFGQEDLPLQFVSFFLAPLLLFRMKHPADSKFVVQCAVQSKRLFADGVCHVSTFRKLAKERCRLSRSAATEVKADGIPLDSLLGGVQPIGG
jgi:hypothetical protein